MWLTELSPPRNRSSNDLRLLPFDRGVTGPRCRVLKSLALEPCDLKKTARRLSFVAPLQLDYILNTREYLDMHIAPLSCRPVSIYRERASFGYRGRLLSQHKARQPSEKIPKNSGSLRMKACFSARDALALLAKDIFSTRECCLGGIIHVDETLIV